MEHPEYKVVWPRGRRTADSARLARRLDTLEGKTVCELWDWLFHGEHIYPAIEKELAKRYPGIKFVSYEVFGTTLARAGSLLDHDEEADALAALPAKLRGNKCDAVLSGLGF